MVLVTKSKFSVILPYRFITLNLIFLVEYTSDDPRFPRDCCFKMMFLDLVDRSFDLSM